MERQNITLSIPKEILLKVKILAVRRGTSVSALMTQVLEEISTSEEGYQIARRSHLKLLQKGIDLGTKGSIWWTRDELHTR